MSEKRKPTYQEIIKLCNKKDKEIERLHSIIKEVRERLIKPSKFIERTERLKLLEILDKVVNAYI